MRVKGVAALALSVALVATMSGGVLAQSAPQAQGGAPIRLKAVTFNPAAGQAGAAPLALTRRAAPAGPGYYIVQSPGPITEEWKAAVAGVGAELLDYIPDYAFKVRMTPEAAAELRGLDITSYVGLFHPYYAVSPELVDGRQAAAVRVERGGSRADVEAAAAAAGADLLGAEGEQLIVGGDRAQLERIARALDVAWIEPYRLNVSHNTSAAEVIGVAAPGAGNLTGPAAGGARGRGYDGSTQIAAVADTGLGGGTAATAHRDLPSSRITAIYNWIGTADSCFKTIENDGAVDVGSGHGTHVAGSVLSGGEPGTGLGMGMAPAARLVFQATENYVITSSLCKSLYGYQDDYYLTGLPADLRQLFQQAYTAGARVHANSWGSAAAGSYTSNSAYADQFIWSNKDMAITFSAGNEGADANADGVVDNDSIGAPATAKNVITVGASENKGDTSGNFPCDATRGYTSRDTSYQSGQTCTSMGGTNWLGTPRQRWGFTANPIADDPTGGNPEQMAAFSSRGPTDDGRIKPDVVAPGTWILSTYSDLYQEGYDSATNPKNNAFQSDGWGMPRTAYYKYFGGTSMSNPIAAGGAVLVRDYYQKAHGLNASAALVKATLINTAVDLLDENNDGFGDNDFPIPNVHEGWGRINIDSATDGNEKFFDVSAGLATNASKTYDVTLGGGPLKVSLAWSDYAAAANAAVTLVNNLNLTVTAPNGTTTYLGNVFSGGWSATGGSADARNNVENVYIQAPTAGTWKITVTGTNVPQGPQPFALVVGGASSVVETTPPPPAPPAAPSNLRSTAAARTSITLAWNDNSADETSFELERCTGSTCTSFTRIATLGANTVSYNNTGLTRNTTYRYRIRAVNAGGASAYSNVLNASTTR
jgi:serine protease AprX